MYVVMIIYIVVIIYLRQNDIIVILGGYINLDMFPLYNNYYIIT